MEAMPIAFSTKIEQIPLHTTRNASDYIRMRRNGVKVIIRTRPTAKFASSQIQINPDENTILIQSPESSVSHLKNAQKQVSRFKYHQILHNAGQDRVYEAIARNIVDGVVVDGVNGTILAYGQTGAGKSFTMLGDTRNYQHRGIAPRAIAQIFEKVQNTPESIYTITASYMEIYNDKMYDLLLKHDKAAPIEEYAVVEDHQGTCVRGMTQIKVESEKEALDQLFYGELQRTIATHQLNKRSNRSHCIFTLHISRRSCSYDSDVVVHSKLHLVDLAGSERLKKTMNEPEDVKSGLFSPESRTKLTFQEMATIKKESMYINQSLSFLEQCIVALGTRGARHIPYRQTKLTNALKDSLGGNSNTLMFACIWGESRHLEETISTLKLAQRMMHVQNQAAAIVETDTKTLLRRYEKQIDDLKQELRLHDALTTRVDVTEEDHTLAQKLELKCMIERFLEAPNVQTENQVLRLHSIRDIRESFRQFKSIYKKLEGSSEPLGRKQIATDRVPEANLVDVSNNRKPTPNTLPLDVKEPLVGKPDTRSFGFGIGHADANAKPNVLEGILRPQDQRMKPNNVSAAGKKDDLKAPRPMDGFETKSLTNEMKSRAFLEFKIGPGKLVYRRLQEEKDILHELKQKIKGISKRLVGVKGTIEGLQTSLEAKRSHHRSSIALLGHTVDEEEYALIASIPEQERAYRALFEELKRTKCKFDIAQSSVDSYRASLVNDFESWFSRAADPQICVEAVSMDASPVASSLPQINGNSEQLDACEQFDRMEIERVKAQDPDSLAFFQAKRAMRQNSEHAAQIRLQRNTKRGL
uniref:Kinesin-like protein n=1 Tax=Albugo laibachii Nc14 TaxID=890382 RepID=F0W8X4_9STRA|nr:kinesinlike protein putative [Albugo laibachii Nc14]|eukprot:CCA17585.1 kinesinlike protein putative [Albugo laibachii Nc14]